MKQALIALVLTLVLIAGCDKQLAQPALTALDSTGIITDGQGHGSCVAIGPDLVLTAGHCIGHPGSWIEVGGQKYDIVDQWASPTDDVGLVKIDPNGVPLKPLKLGQMPNVLDLVFIIGAPQDTALANNLTAGVVSKLDVDLPNWDDLISTDAASWYGNSGGPLLNAQGEVIGVLVTGVDGTSISLCEPVTDVQQALIDYQGDH